MIDGSYAYDWLYLRKELIGRGLSKQSFGHHAEIAYLQRKDMIL